MAPTRASANNGFEREARSPSKTPSPKNSLNKNMRVISWALVVKYVKLLRWQLNTSNSRGGCGFDAIVGITGGGLIVADLLGGTYKNVPILSLNAVHGDKPNFEHWANSHTIEALKNIRRLLIVDDVVRNGVTLLAAQTFLASNLRMPEIKSAALIADNRVKRGIPTYRAVKLNTKNIVMPRSALERM